MVDGRDILQSEQEVHVLVHLHLGHLANTFVQPLTVIHTLIAGAAMQGADQHMRSSFGVQRLVPGHFDMQTRGMEPATF